MWKVSSAKTARIFRRKTLSKCSNILLCRICCTFSVLQGVKLHMPVALSIEIVILGFWLQTQSVSKHARLSCGTILQDSCCCDHQVHLSRWNRSRRSFLGTCLVMLYSAALWISERWHKQPLKGHRLDWSVAVVQAENFQELLFFFSLFDVCQILCPRPTTLTVIQKGWCLCCFYNMTVFTGTEVFLCCTSALPTLWCSFLLGCI